MVTRRWRFALKLAFGFGVLALLLYQADLTTLRDALGRINVWVLVSLPVFYVHIFFKTLRWRAYLQSQGVKISLGSAFSVYLNGTFLGLISPGRVGEVYRAWILVKNKSASLGLGVASVFVDRMADLIGLGVLGFLGFLYLLQQGLDQTVAPAVIGLIADPVRRGATFLKRSFTRMAEKIPRPEGRGLADEYADFIAGLKGFTPRLTLTIALLTLLSIGTYCLHLYFIAYVLGLPLNFLEIVAVLSVATFINVLPISINGLGTRDAFLVLTLPLLGVDRDLALAYSLTFLLLFVANTLMSLPFWLRGATPMTTLPVEPSPSREVL